MPKFLLCSFLLFFFSQILFAQAPANDNCAGAVILPIQAGSCTTTITGNTANATKSAQTAFIQSATDDDIWYKFTTPESADPEARFMVMLQLSNLAFTNGTEDIFIERREGATYICDDYYPDNQTFYVGSPTNWTMTGLKPSTVYSIRLYTNNESSRVAFNICLYIPTPPANDNCDAPVVLTPELNTCTPAGPYSTLTATKSPQASGDGSGRDDDVWFTFTTPAESRKFIAELSNRTYNTGFGNTVIELWGLCGNTENLVFAPFASSADLGVLSPSTTYRLRIYTYGTSSRLNSFNICVKMVSPPVNDECGNAIPIVVGPVGSFGPVVQGTTQNASQSAQPTTPCLTYADDDVWYRFTAPASGLVSLKIDNVSNPAGGGIAGMASMLYSGTCNSLVSRQCVGTNNGSFTGLTPGQEYYLRVMTNDGGAVASFDIALQALQPPPNDNCADAVTVPVNTDLSYNLFVNGTTNLAQTSSVPLSPCTPVASNDVWYQFTAPTTGVLQMRLFNVVNPQSGSISTYSILYSGNCTTPVHVRCITATTENLEGLTPGAVYYLRVMSNAAGQYVNFSLGLRLLPAPMVNTTCAAASALTTEYQPGTTLGLPANNDIVACYGSKAPNKVAYYQFTATATWHYIDVADIIQLSLNAAGVGFRVSSGTCEGDLVGNSVACISGARANNAPITGLTIGNTYIVQLMENTFNGGPVAFKIRLAPPNSFVWLGGESTAWEEPLNWVNKAVPTGTSEVIIPPGRPRYPRINVNTTVRRMTASPGTNVQVAPGVQFTVQFE
jgi:hypothetical protein